MTTSTLISYICTRAPPAPKRAKTATSADPDPGEPVEKLEELILKNASENLLLQVMLSPNVSSALKNKVIQRSTLEFGRLAFAINYAQPRRLRFDNLKDALKYFNDEKIDEKDYPRRVAILRLKYYEMLRRCSSITSEIRKRNNKEAMIFYLYAQVFHKKGGQSSTDQQDEVKYTEEELDMFEKTVDTYKQYMRDHWLWHHGFDSDGFFGFE